MTTRGQINSNFYQIVNVDGNGNPTSIKDSYVANANVNHANVANTANTAITAITVTNSSQPNITSLGTMSSLTSNGNITAPYFIGNVVGNIVGNFVVPGVTYDVIYNNNGNAAASDNFTFNFNTNTLTVLGNVTTTNANLGNLTESNYFSGNGSLLTSITGANVTGTVSDASHSTVSDSANSVAGANVTGVVGNATHATVSDSANSVAVGNVVGLGNIATINLNGNSSQVLAGNGGWITQTGGGTPGGSNTYVQFNDGGVFGGTANFTFNKVTNTLSANNITATSGNLTAANSVRTGNLIAQSGGLVTIQLKYGAVDGAAGITTDLVVGTSGVGNITANGTITTTDNVSVGGTILEFTGGDSSITSASNVSITAPKVILGSNSNVVITGGSPSQVLTTDGTGNLSWATSSSGGTPGGSNTELQFNNNGSFGGISTVTWNGTNINLGAINTVKITGGVANSVIGTDGTGNLQFQAIATSLTVGTRTTAVTIPTSNYQMNVLARTGNVVVSVN